jgi:hypothetical protein
LKTTIKNNVNEKRYLKSRLKYLLENQVLMAISNGQEIFRKIKKQQEITTLILKKAQR